MTQELFPLAEVITPNLPEARQLTGMEITSPAEMEQAAGTLAERYRTAVLLKGGHSVGSCNDLLCADGEMIWSSGERIVTNNTHGTGCTLSSAIAANLAKGFALEEAIARAKAYLTDALNAQLDLGRGSGPLDHTLGGVGVENWMHGVPDAVHK